jgi:fructose transport system substrate-binding protein
MRINVMTGTETNRWQRFGSLLAVGMVIALAACSGGEQKVTIGLITKQEANPYWVTLREVAEDTAEDNAVNLLTATGWSDVDADSQKKALQNMVAEGARGILIAPANSTALVPAIEAARKKGVVVIAVDTPVEPVDAVDAYYATDNESAGRLIGEYAAAKAAELGLEPKIAMLDLAPGISSGAARHKGFLAGFGIEQTDAALVAMADTEGNQELGEARMAEILARHPDVNVVYTVNEPVALGALVALKAAKVNLRKTILVSIDGGCQAIKNAVRPGDIDATAMQFPENMAREGVLALARAARGDEPPSGYLNTGVELVTGDPAPGVESRNVAYGVRNCWGG